MNSSNKKSIKNNTLPDREAILSLKGGGVKTQTAKLNYLRIAPRKVRLVATVIKGMSVNEAEAQLLVNPKRASEAVLKLLRSAVANAKNKQMETEKLIVKEIKVDEGPMLKRWMPRAQGRATPIHKKSSHITMVLAESEKAKKSRFNIVKPKRVKKSEFKKMTAQAKSHEHAHEHINKHEPTYVEDKAKDVKAKEKPSILKRIFRRKVI